MGRHSVVCACRNSGRDRRLCTSASMSDRAPTRGVRQTSNGHATAAAKYTVKISVYVYGYFAASFPYFNETGSVYVCIRKLTE